MNLLLDTHILLWHLADSTQLSFETSALIENEANAKFLRNVARMQRSVIRATVPRCPGLRYASSRLLRYALIIKPFDAQP